MSTSLRSLFLTAFTGFALISAVKADTLGGFFHAGPQSADAPVLSIRWTYGFRFNIDPATVTQVKLSCDPIPGTSFTVAGVDLKIKPNGVAIWEGPVLPVSQESTAWLLDNTSTTEATCEAVISRVGVSDVTQQAPVQFAPAQKVATLQQLIIAFKFNSKPPNK